MARRPPGVRARARAEAEGYAVVAEIVNNRLFRPGSVGEPAELEVEPVPDVGDHRLRRRWRRVLSIEASAFTGVRLAGIDRPFTW